MTYCDSSTISSATLMSIVDNIRCLNNCFKSNEIIGTTAMQCTAFSLVNDWSYGSYTWLHTFPLSNDIQFSYSGNYWASLIVGGSNAAWSVKYKLNTLNRTDTGKVNSSPTTLLAPMIVIRQGFAYGISIPTMDADSSDTVKCRWSITAAECGGICQSVPFGVLNSSCYFYINATTAVVGLYAAAFQIEDFATNTSTTALSSVPIQFVVWIKYINSTCTTSPTIIGDLPLDACIVANNNLTTRILANESCSPTESITDIVILSFTNLASSNLAKLTNSTWYKNMTWIPPK